jgi:hypothetical protein
MQFINKESKSEGHRKFLCLLISQLVLNLNDLAEIENVLMVIKNSKEESDLDFTEYLRILL